MKMDIKKIIGFLTTALFGILVWALITLVEIKSDQQHIKGELSGIDRAISRIYGFINSSKWKQ